MPTAVLPTPTPRVTPSATPATATPTLSPTLSPTPEPSPTAEPPTATPTHVPQTLTPTPTPTIALIHFLQITGPANSDVFWYDNVIVFGITSPGSVVKVNGETAFIEGGNFQAQIPLAQGANNIAVESVSATGQVEKAMIEVTSLGAQPVPLYLTVNEPRQQQVLTTSPAVVRGRTTPDAVVTVQGVSVSVDGLGGFETTVRLAEGPQTIEIIASDRDGNEEDAIIAVIYRPVTQP